MLNVGVMLVTCNTEEDFLMMATEVWTALQVKPEGVSAVASLQTRGTWAFHTWPCSFYDLVVVDISGPKYARNPG